MKRIFFTTLLLAVAVSAALGQTRQAKPYTWTKEDLAAINTLCRGDVVPDINADLENNIYMDEDKFCNCMSLEIRHYYKSMSHLNSGGQESVGEAIGRKCAMEALSVKNGSQHEINVPIDKKSKWSAADQENVINFCVTAVLPALEEELGGEADNLIDKQKFCSCLHANVIADFKNYDAFLSEIGNDDSTYAHTLGEKCGTAAAR